jgi:NAD+ synthase
MSLDSALHVANDRWERQALALDCDAEERRIAGWLRQTIGAKLGRRGVVLGVSGGVDSAVCTVLAARALGPGRVLALLMPDLDTAPEGMARAQRLCQTLQVVMIEENITAALIAMRCYERRDDAIRQLFPQFDATYKSKIRLAEAPPEQRAIPHFQIVIESADGTQYARRLPSDLQSRIVAATNMKQRTRKQVEYYHADRLNYAVLGTPNRLEYDLGFFVRGGDGLADAKPLAHLYKSQVYALAEHLGVSEEIRRSPPSTDTYSLAQTQQEFYFALPYRQMDLLLYAFHHDIAPHAAGLTVGLTALQVENAYKDIRAKRRLAHRLLQGALLLSCAEPGSASA